MSRRLTVVPLNPFRMNPSSRDVLTRAAIPFPGGPDSAPVRDFPGWLIAHLVALHSLIVVILACVYGWHLDTEPLFLGAAIIRDPFGGDPLAGYAGVSIGSHALLVSRDWATTFVTLLACAVCVSGIIRLVRAHHE